MVVGAFRDGFVHSGIYGYDDLGAIGIDTGQSIQCNFQRVEWRNPRSL